MKNKRLIITLLITLILPITFLQAETEKFKVGVILPLTGPLSLQGVPMKNAILMAKEELDVNNQLALIIEDDAFIPRNTVLATTKLINQDKIQALIVFGTNQSLSVVDLSEKKKIPFLSINVNPNVSKGRKYTVITMPTLQKLTALNINESLKRGYKKIAIIASQQDSCLLQRKIMEDSKKFEIVYSDEISPTEVKVREFAFKAVSKNPDAIFLSVIPPQGSLLAKSIREFGYQGDLFGGLQIANLTERDASQGALLNAWVVSGDDRLATKYYENYLKKFKEQPTTESIYAYDSLKLLINGINSGDLNKYIHEVTNLEGHGGKYSADQDNSFDFPVVAKKITQNGFEYIP